MENKEIIEKIKKLYDKANSSKELNSLDEANVFFEKVQDLLIKYNLSLDEVINVKSKEEIEYLKGKENGIEYFHNINEGFQWEPQLMNMIAINNNCFMYKTEYQNKVWCAKNKYYPYMTLVGRASDKENCIYFYEIATKILRKLSVESYTERVNELREKYSVQAQNAEEAYIELLEELIARSSFGLDREIISLIKYLKSLSYEEKKNLFMPKSYKEEDLKKKQTWYLKDLVKVGLMKNRTTYIQSFLLGAAFGVGDVLKKSKNNYIENLEFEEREQVNALILSNKNELELFVKENIGNLRTTSNYVGDSFAYRDGINKGSNISLNKGLNSSNGNFINLLK